MKTALLSLVVLLIGGLFVAWFLATHERVVIEVPARYQGEARFNDFLAAELLLRALHIEADSRASLNPSTWLPEPADTLLTRASAAWVAEEELAHLEAWVLSGGHLVLLAPRQRTLATDAVFEHFGFRLIESEPAERDAGERLLTGWWSEESEANAYTVVRTGAPQSLEILNHESLSATLADEEGLVAVRQWLGGGAVTVIAESLLFQNGLLAASDHARLLLDLVAGDLDPGQVWLVYDVEFAPLWRVVWNRLPYAVLGAALILLLWLWSVIPRFGPEIAPAAAARRSILEHVEAAGSFVWRYDGAASLLASSAAAVLRRAEPMRPGIARLAPSQQAAGLAELTNQPAGAVLAALDPPEPMGQREFTRAIQIMQKVRKEL